MRSVVSWWTALALLVAACEAEEQGVEGEIAAQDQAVIGWTAANLKWILYAVPGTAKLAKRDRSTGVVTVRATHSFATHWRAVSIAGNKLLWQRTDTGELSLWTIDAAGGYVRHRSYAAPAAGWRAVSIALEDDGACPAKRLEFRSYVIAFEGPFSLLRGDKPPPFLWTVNDNGDVTASESLPNRISAFTALRDFRPARDGRWGLVSVDSVVRPAAGATASVTYYLKHNGVWLRLRADHYSAGDGLTGCTLFPDGVGNTSCATSFVDTGPGVGHTPASFQLAQDTNSSQFANNLVWTTSGTAKVHALEALGHMDAPAAVLVGPAGYPVVSVAAADESDPENGLICDHRPPPIPRPGDFE
jgi:hypothetical protein